MMTTYEYLEINGKAPDNEQMTLTYTYYSRLRPVSIGTYPKPKNNHFISFTNYDDRKEVRPNVWAWGEITYKHPLSQEDMDNYDLI